MTVWLTSLSLLGQSLAWSLLVSLLQGLLLYGIVYVVFKAYPNADARQKHNVAYAAILFVAAWFMYTWYASYTDLKGTVVYITSNSTATGARDVAMTPLVVHATAVEGEVNYFSISKVQQFFPMLSIAYLVGLLFMILRLGINMRYISHLRTQALQSVGEHIEQLTHELAEQLHISKSVKIFISAKVDVPTMIGFVKPIILLPAATLAKLSAQQLEAILLHELAHIKRNDYLLNLVQTTIETILFFNPFIWLLSRMVRKEREHCCDDIVVAQTERPLEYATALAMLETAKGSVSQLAMGAAGKKNVLLNRIKRIMEMKRNNKSYSYAAIISVLAVGTMFTAAMFSPTFAQKSRKESKNTPATKSNMTYSYTKVFVDSNGKQHVETKNNMQDDSNVHVYVSYGDEPLSDKLKETIYKAVNGDTVKAEKILKEVADIKGNTKREARVTVKQINSIDLGDELNNATVTIKNIDWDKIGKDIEVELDKLDEIDVDKIASRISAELSASKAEVARAMAEAKRAMAEVDINMTRSGRVEPPMPPAPPAADDANSVEHMLDEMEEEGLINRKHAYSIKKRDGELYINGELQPKKVYRKYNRYLPAESVQIKGSKNKLKIAMEN